ncbi:MAG TPA: LuxR C-terminal-related transcriptional regulator [Chroococcales cyanobacterium]|jgi:LuxR family maltose regulon positive regulatory protein
MKQDLPLLPNKTAIPPCPPVLVDRPRLFRRLDESAQRRLTLISASAGYGKTSLLSSWSRHCGFPVYWLSLDEGDNDPVRFLAYFIHALGFFSRDLEKELLALLHSPRLNQFPSSEGMLTSILSEIPEGENPFALVLDDYHRIHSQAVHDSVTFMLEQAPAHFHLVISTRSALPLPLGRMRLNEQTLELQDQELRFTDEESAIFFKNMNKKSLSEHEIFKLTFFTEGWIAGMKLALISLEQSLDPTSSIAHFKGRHRHTFDYLSEEILNRQTSEVRDFLLKTSILESFDASLCDAVTGRTDGHKTMEALEKSNLFVVPLDHERRWYRYHHLFSEFLQSHLRLIFSPEIPALHRLAAGWHEKNGNTAEGIAHFLAAEDFEQAGRLIERSSKTLLMQNQTATLMGWLNRLPEDWLRSQPSLCVLRGWCLVLTFQLDELDSWLMETAKRCQESAEMLAIRAIAASQRGEKALDLVRTALEGLSEEDVFSYNIVFMALGLEYGKMERYRESSEIFKKTARLSRVSGDFFTNILSLAYLANNEKILGNLKQGAEYARQAIECPNAPLPAISVPCVIMGDILYEWNEIDLAIQYLKKGIKLDKQWGNLDDQLYGSLLLLRALKANEEPVDELLTEIERISLRPELAHVLPWTALYKARNAFLERDLDACESWIRERGYSVLALDGPLHPFMEQEFELLADFRLAKGQPDQALRISELLLEHAEKSGKLRTAISGRLIEALGRQQKGETSRALVLLEEALALAEPQNFLLIFLEKGAAMAALLSEFIRAEGAIEKTFAHKLLYFLKLKSTRAALPLLSEREREVLDFIKAGKSNNEIAEEMCVTIATIKKHINGIYAKLDIKNRAEVRTIVGDTGSL